MKTSFFLGLISLVLVSVLFCPVSQAKSKVGYINLQRLVSESKMGKAAQADILKMRKEREASVDYKLRQINLLKDQLKTQGDTMSADDKQDKIEALQKTYKEYQRMVADAKEEIVKEDRQLVKVILNKADKILKKVAQKKGYTIILKDPNSVGYLDPDVDITDDVLHELNRK